MCFMRTPAPQPIRVAAPDNREARQSATMEARLRRRRSGAAANILTSPVGIPAVRTMGGVAA